MRVTSPSVSHDTYPLAGPAASSRCAASVKDGRSDMSNDTPRESTQRSNDSEAASNEPRNPRTIKCAASHATRTTSRRITYSRTSASNSASENDWCEQGGNAIEGGKGEEKGKEQKGKQEGGNQEQGRPHTHRSSHHTARAHVVMDDGGSSGAAGAARSAIGQQFCQHCAPIACDRDACLCLQTALAEQSSCRAVAEAQADLPVVAFA